MKIISVIGARPQLVKAAIVSRALRIAGLEEYIVHTGQHYDVKMSSELIDELGITNIIENFGVGSGSHAVQTSSIMEQFDQFLARQSGIAAVMVYGDTNSTLGAALVASKRGIPIVHVEAGLRSFNREMPEEINRVLVDHISNILFCSSLAGKNNLVKEGIQQGVSVVGDVMLDAFNHYSNKVVENDSAAEILKQAGAGPFALVTIHRPSNTDYAARFSAIVRQIGQLEMPCIWPVHPRLKASIRKFSLQENTMLHEPFSYFEMLRLLQNCAVVITDSGGLQKEAYWAKKPCITMRSETEWTETVDQGWNMLFDPKGEVQLTDIIELERGKPWKQLYGSGIATEKIASILDQFVS